MARYLPKYSLISFVIILLGFSFLWFGLQPAPVAVPLPTPSPTAAALGIEGQKALVINVIDGDTIEIEGGQTVRLIGIDTPETVDPRRPVGCFGKEASKEAKSLLENKVIILQKDVSENDKYGRLLRYVYLPLENDRMLFVNDYLVRAGFAKVLTYPPDVKFNEQLREAEREAKEEGRGLWGKC